MVDCYNFSSCVSYEWNQLSRDWDRIFKTEQRIEREGDYHSEIRYQWDDQTQDWKPLFWTLNTKENGRQKYQEYAWNPDRQDWGLLLIREKEFDEGFLILDAERVYRVDEGIWYGLKEDRVYLRNNRPGEIIQHRWNHEEEAWVPENKQLLTYKAFPLNVELITHVTFSWAGTLGGWQLAKTEEHIFDEFGTKLRVEIRHEDPLYFEREEFLYSSTGEWIGWQEWTNFDPATGWVGQLKHEYGREPLGDSSFTYQNEYFWDLTRGEWEKHRRTQNIWYNSYLVCTKKFLWNTDSLQWNLLDSFEQIRDSGAFVNESIRFFYQPNGSRTGRKEERKPYPGTNRVAQTTESSWNDSLRIWTYERRNETHFTPDLQEYGYSSYRWDEQLSTWLGVGRRIFTFDSFGNLVFSSRRQWDVLNQEWVPDQGFAQLWSDCQQTNNRIFTFQSISTYPNPVSDDWLYVDTKFSEPLAYEILATDGRNVSNGEIEPLHDRIALANLNNGLYVIRFFVGEKAEMKKVVVRR